MTEEEDEIVQAYNDRDAARENARRLRIALDKAREQIELAIKMRHAQRRYFKTRGSADLIEAKQFERQFDEEIGR